MQMNTIGLSILYREFKSAMLFYSKNNKTNRYYRVASDSIAFIQGTGLDIILNYYGLMYDAERLRNGFFSMVGDHEKIS